MKRNQIKSKVMARVIIKAGLSDSFIKFLKRLNIEIPSKEKARKMLEKYDEKDIQEAYKNIPKILEKFSLVKKADEPLFTDIQKTLILLICIISLAGGVLPTNPKAALDVLQEEQIKEDHFEYLGAVSKKDLVAIIKPSDNFEAALEKIQRSMVTQNINYTGEIPKNKNFKIVSPKNKELKTTQEILEYPGSLLKIVL